ncbi:hypothetical protein PG984_003485 [Apiospora sp. TS-2023a]
MYRKLGFLNLITGCLLAGVGAQEFKNVNIYSDASCGSDPNDLDVLTHQLSFSPKVGGPYEKAQWSNCYQSNIKLGGWKKTEEGKYAVYVDTSDLGGRCILNFYSTHPGSGFACQNKYKSLSIVRNTCPMIALSEGFGFA